MCLIPIYPMCGDTAGHCGVKKDHYALLILSLENTSAPYLCEVYILMLYQYMYSFLWLTTSYSCNGRFFFTPIWSRSFFTPLYDTISRLLVNASYNFFMFIMSIYCCGLATTAANLLQVQHLNISLFHSQNYKMVNI